jgi:hypothetical protein
MIERIEAAFPGLRNSPFRITSPANWDYNCIAWAAGDTANWWRPDPDAAADSNYWPPSAPKEETLAAFVTAFATLGYGPSSGEDFEPGFEKVALFARGDKPTHAARQLPSGRWTSKLGKGEDIEHELHAVSGEAYGAVVLMVKRPIAATAAQ